MSPAVTPRLPARAELTSTGVRRDATALAFLWAGLTLSLAPFLMGRVPWDPDSALFYLPMKALVGDMLRQGHLPFWTSLIGLGYPLLGDGEAGPLYPPDALLFALFSPDVAYGASIAFHALLAAALMYGFLRRMGLPIPAGLVGAVVFTYMGPVLSNLGSPHMEAASWWPGLLLAVHGLTDASASRWRPWWFASGAAVVALMHLVGSPQVAVQGLMLSGVYALYRVWRLPPGTALGQLLWAAGMVLVGTALAAPQLLLTADLIGQSARADGAGAQASLGSLFPPVLVELLSPSWHFAAVRLAAGPNAYVGMGAVGLALLAARHPAGGARFWQWVFLATLVLAMGRFTPLFAVTSHLPVLTYFRVPARYLYLSTTALAIMAAYGMAALQRRDPQVARTIARAIGTLAIVVLGVDLLAWAVLRVTPDFAFKLVASAAGGHASGAQSSEFFSAALQASSPDKPDLWLPVVGLLGLGFAAYGLKRRWRYSSDFVVGVVVLECLLVGGPFWAALGPAQPGGPVRLTAPETLGLIPRGEAGRIYTFGPPVDLASQGRTDVLPPNLNVVYGVPTIGLYGVFGDPRYEELLHPLGAVDLSFGAMKPDADAPARHRGLLNLLGAATILSPQVLDGFEPAGETSGAYVYRNPHAFPRAWVVEQVQARPGDSGMWVPTSDLDLRRVAVVDGTVPVLAGVAGEARIVKDEGISVSAAANGPGLLVLADRWAPGWSVEVDGRPEPLLRVDGILRGVVLPPGPHAIAFSYTPLAWTPALALALSAVMVLVVVVGWSCFSWQEVPRQARTRVAFDDIRHAPANVSI